MLSLLVSDVVTMLGTGRIVRMQSIRRFQDIYKKKHIPFLQQSNIRQKTLMLDCCGPGLASYKNVPLLIYLSS